MQDNDVDPEECIAEFDLEELVPSSQPMSPIPKLAQSAAASLTPITAAASSNAARRAEMNAATTIAQKRLDELVRNDPLLSQGTTEHFVMRFEVTPFMKAKPGSSKAYIALINHILTEAGAVKSQTQIRRDVTAMFPSYTVAKDWTKPIPAWAVKKTRERIQNSAAPISNIQLQKAVTLSQLHAAVRAVMEHHKTGAKTFKPIIEVSDTAVIINGVAFPVSNNIVKGEIYKQVRASMPKFLEALNSRQ